jgi:cytochrome c-type biogenesis protein CcmF
MLADIGYYALFATILLAAWAMGASLVGGVLRQEAWVRSGERAIHVVFGLCVFCTVALIVSIFAEDYSLSYVAQVSDRALPAVYKFTSFWAGMAGSMLMWLLFLAAYSSAAVFSLRKRHRELAPWVSLTLGGVLLFFAAMTAFMANPLARLDFILDDGKGMNPALQNYWMAIHPPTLYVGYTGLAVPFAFAVAALITGRLDTTWIAAVRRWMLLPWLALGVGMIFGGRWAYEELGWGGYWAWDPVENASLMPWLLATAYLHSVMLQERRGMFRVWNLILVISAFLLSILGTAITRSGIVESVHSFARSAIGPWFFAFVIGGAAMSAALIYYRLPDLKAENRIDSLVSREFSFMLNNLAFVAITVVTLFLTLYPSLSEYFTGERRWVGPSAYNEINGSLGLLLLVLTGIGPVVSWRRASWKSLRRNFSGPVAVAAVTAACLMLAGIEGWMSLAAWSGSAFVICCIFGEFHRGARVLSVNHSLSYAGGLMKLFGRNRRRYGGYIVHLSVVMLFIGVAGMAYRSDLEAKLMPGETVELVGYSVTYREPVPYRGPGSDVYSIALEVRKDGILVDELRPEFKIHDKFPEPEKDVAIHQTWSGDLYAILAQPVLPSDPAAKIQILWNPLVSWVWGAGHLMLLGTLVCIWPDRRRQRQAARVARAA